MEPELVSALSEAKGLFRLLRFYTETESFGVSIEPKQTEEQPKQCDREHILVFFPENLGLFRFVSVCFGLFRFFSVCFGLFRFVSVCYETVCFGSIPKQRISMFRLNRNKQKTNQNSLIESIFWYFSENLGLFGLFRNSSVCFICFDIGTKHRNKPNFFVFGFMKQTETQPKQILFRFVSVRTKIFFCLFRGHPSLDSIITLIIIKFSLSKFPSKEN
jgi:hypothetical protein